MIHNFDNIQKEELEVIIIPKLKGFEEWSLCKEDTIVAFIDFDKYDIQEISEIHKMLMKVFPSNQTMVLPKGTKLGVIRNDK